jgi:hypothetical protein
MLILLGRMEHVIYHCQTSLLNSCINAHKTNKWHLILHF